MEDDNKYYINPETFQYITKQPIRKYYLCRLKIMDIYRVINNKVQFLDETDVYKYIKSNRDEHARKAYIKYCKKNNMDNSLRSPELCNELCNEFVYNKYDIKKGIIVVDQYNRIIDGQHRCCILLQQYGGAYEITVLKLWYKKMGITAPLSHIKYCIRKKFRHLR